uniref:Uncharacterized protein n=1 Tax=Ascaris lumbricoides TaxID=6252 RepID=A0A0M3HFJ7_ASCLU
MLLQKTRIRSRQGCQYPSIKRSTTKRNTAATRRLGRQER